MVHELNIYFRRSH